jgi:WD40 repeat protein
LPQAAFPIAVSPDGRYLAASAGSTIQVWQVDSGKQLHALKLPAPDAGRIGFGSQVRSLAFSSDGKKLLAGLAGGPVAAWDLVSGKAEATKEAGQKTAPSGTTVVSPDGKYAAWCEINLMQQSTAIKVKDLTTGQEVANIKGAAVDGRNLTFTPDGKTLAWTQLAGIQLLEIGKDAEPRTLGKVEQRFRPIASVNFAPDGQTVALSTSQRTIELWDLKTGKLLREFGDPERDGGGPQFTIVGVGNTNIRMDDVAFSKDGKTVAAALGGNFVRQFDLATGKEIVTAEPGHRLPVGNVQLSPDGTMLTTAAARDSVRLWDLAQAKEIKKIPLTAQHGAVALSADGRRVYVAKVGTIEIWDVMTGERVGEVKAGNILIAALAVSPNGKTLAVRSAQGGAIQLWDTATGKKTGVLADQVPETGGIRRVMVGLGQASGVATAEIVFSPDGRFIAGASANRHLSLWDVSTGARLWETEVPAVDRFAFAADGRMLALLNPDGTVSLVEACTGQARGTLGQARPKVDDGMRATVFVPGGLPPTFNDARPNPHALAFSADGRYLATSHAEQSIHLWDLETGKQIDPLMGHQGGIAGLSFSADRKHLVSGSLDTTTMVWDLSRKLKPRPAADEPLDIKALAADFAGKDAAKAYDALSKLSRHPAPAVALARDLVKPVPAPDPLKLKQLLIDLNSSKFDARRQATADLEKMGDVILPALKEALKTESTLEGVQRLEMVLKKLSNPARGGGVVVELRTVELLELMGTSEARKLLESLAAGADGARLTQEARVSLERLTRRQ